MFLVAVDAFSKWPEVVQMSSTTAEKTVDILRRIFSRTGLPDQLHSDNGPQFTSECFQQFMKYNGIKHTTSAPYHPRTNGLAERLVQTLKQTLRASKTEQTSINKALANFLLTYRNTPHTTTGETPAKLFMGRELCTRLTRLKPSVRDTVEIQQDKMRTMITEPARQFENGTHVAVRDYREQGGKWIPGIIAAKTGPLSYKVEIAPGTMWRRHTDQLRSADFVSQPPTAPVLVPDDNSSLSSTVPNTASEQFQDKDSLASNESCDAQAPLAPASPTPTQERRYPLRCSRGTLPKRYQD